MSIQPVHYEWPPEKDDVLIALYPSHGCRAIATAMGDRSYQSVKRRIVQLMKAGKLEPRVAVPFQFAPSQHTPGKPYKRRKLVAAPEAIGPLNEIAGNTCCQFIDADHLSDPGARMCGHPGYPWCEYHRKVVYAPKQLSAEERDEAARKSLEAFNASPFGRYAAVR